MREWWRFRFASVDRKEAWGYAVWGFFGVLVAVPELWAAISPSTARWPTISATVGYLEYHHVWVSIVVTGAIVGAGYSALRYKPERTGVLPPRHDPATGGQPGDPAVPYRTAQGRRLTMAVRPVAELGAGLYFGVALAVITAATAVAALTTDADDEYAVGQTLYGLTALFWVAIPTALAFPRRFALDIPFPTLVETLRHLDRRLRVVAVVVAAGLAYLLLHLLLYPWPATIPDIQDLHRGKPPAPTAP